LAPEDVLVKWNETVIRDAMQFIRLVQDTQAGSKVGLGVIRQGKPTLVTAVIEHRKPEESPGTIIFKFPNEISLPPSRVEGEVMYRKLPGPASRSDRPRLGIEIVGLTTQLAKYLQMPGQTGLLVSNVEPNMPAALKGIHVGDVIVSIDGQRFLDPQAFSAYVQSRPWGSTIAVKLLRKGAERSASIQLQSKK
jgi:serine protease Do